MAISGEEPAEGSVVAARGVAAAASQHAAAAALTALAIPPPVDTMPPPPAAPGMTTPTGAPMTEGQQLAYVQLRQSPFAAGVGDKELIRFLSTCKYRADAAAEMLRKRQVFRDANFPLGHHPGSVPLTTIKEIIAERRFEVLPKRNSDGQKVLYVSLRDFSHGRYQVVDHVVSFIYMLEESFSMQGGDLGGGAGVRDDFVCVINCDGVKRPPTALLQRLTPPLSAYYPGVLRKIVMYPVSRPVEQVIKQMLPFVDVGGLTEQAGVAYVNSLEVLARECGLLRTGLPLLAGGDQQASAPLRLEDFPASLFTARSARRDPVHADPAAPRGSNSPPPPGSLREQAYTLRTKGKFKHMSEKGEFVVYTPWYPEGVKHQDVTLEEEMVEFARFMLLSYPEQQEIVRGGLRTSLQGLVQKAWPEATVKTVGSLATQTITTGRPVQFAVEGCGDLSALPVVLELMRQSGLQVDCPDSVEAVACGSFVQVSGQAVRCDVSFHSEQSAARQSIPVLKKWLKEFPAARTVYVVLFHVLEQTKCVGRGNGGISAKALLLMVLHVCRSLDSQQRAARTLNPELVLRRCLAYYGREFDFNTCSIDAKALEPVPKLHPNPLVVLDPVVPAMNCAADCFRIQQIRMHLQYCEKVLDADAEHLKGRRGRTPLSALVSYDSLWGRRRELNARLSLLRCPDKLDGTPTGGTESPTSPSTGNSSPPHTLQSSNQSTQSAPDFDTGDEDGPPGHAPDMPVGGPGNECPGWWPAHQPVRVNSDTHHDRIPFTRVNSEYREPPQLPNVNLANGPKEGGDRA